VAWSSEEDKDEDKWMMWVTCGYCERWYHYECALKSIGKNEDASTLYRDGFACTHCRNKRKKVKLVKAMARPSKFLSYLEVDPVWWQKLPEQLRQEKEKLGLFMSAEAEAISRDHLKAWDVSAKPFRKPDAALVKRIELIGCHVEIKDDLNRGGGEGKNKSRFKTCVVVNHEERRGQDHHQTFQVFSENTLREAEVFMMDTTRFRHRGHLEESEWGKLRDKISKLRAGEPLASAEGSEEPGRQKKRPFPSPKKHKSVVLASEASFHEMSWGKRRRSHHPTAREAEDAEEGNPGPTLRAADDLFRALEANWKRMQSSMNAIRATKEVLCSERDKERVSNLFREIEDRAGEGAFDRDDGDDGDGHIDHVRLLDMESANNTYLEEVSKEMIDADIRGELADATELCMDIYSLRMFTFSESDEVAGLIPCIIKSLRSHPLALVRRGVEGLLKEVPGLLQAARVVPKRKWEAYRNHVRVARERVAKFYHNKDFKVVKTDLIVREGPDGQPKVELSVKEMG